MSVGGLPMLMIFKADFQAKGEEAQESDTEVMTTFGKATNL